MDNIREEFFEYDIGREKLYYLAHPYTGDGTVENMEDNYRIANRRTITLMKLGYNIFSPITYTHVMDVENKNIFDVIDWLKLDKIFLDRCDGIIMAPGWEDSLGCRLEYEYAIKSNKEILFYEKIIS